MDTKQIAELAAIVKQNGLSKLEIEEGAFHIILEAQTIETPMIQNNVQTVQAPEVQFVAEPVATEHPPVVHDDCYEQKTPLVGTVYLAPKADAEPFVKIGDHVQAGQTVCIVESMKMFNEIGAECSGTIEEICVNNAQIVEYGQILVRIKED